MTKFYKCMCFHKRNIYVKRLNMHFCYESEEQFGKDYKNVLVNLTSDERTLLLKEIKDEIEHRVSIEGISLKNHINIKHHYVPLYPSLYHLKKEYLDKNFLAFSLNAATAKNVDDILPHLNIISEDPPIYQFPVFTKDFCLDFINEIEHFKRSSLTHSRPNSMNNYGVLLDELGFYEGLVDPLREIYLNPLVKLLFPESTGNGMDSQRAFTVSYEIGKDEDLGVHYDNSEVTLNICLGKEFSDGQLYFLNASDLPNEVGTCSVIASHIIGHGILHKGKHVHGTLPISDGERHNMIIWIRSSSVRNALCPMCNDVPELSPSLDYGDGFTKSANFFTFCNII